MYQKPFAVAGAALTISFRPWVYGLGIGGKYGARDVIKGILAVGQVLTILGRNADTRMNRT